VTSGVTGGSGARPAVHLGSQAVVSTRATPGPQSSRSLRMGVFPKDFVPPLSPRLRSLHGGADHLLTVREVAKRLGVSTATVYALCNRGELVHVRVSNAIRIEPADLAEFIGRRRALRRL
jgi:excisionase family DNA binding protein